MPIRMINRAPGMTTEAYDELMANVAEPLRRSDGFVSHTAEVSPDGVTVTEVWDSREQWRRWFDASVRPHLPPGAPGPTITDVHSALGR